MPPDPRILVIRRRYLGDIVLLGAFLANLRRHRPGARICVLVEPAYAPVLAMNPDVDETLAMPRSAGGWPAFVRRLRACRFTHVFDLDNAARTAFAARLTGAPFRATLHLENVRRHWPSLYTHAAFIGAQDYSSRSIVDNQLALLGTAGVPVATREVRLVPRGRDVTAARKLTGGPRGGPVRRLLVHPGSRSAFRLWPVERFAAVCDEVQDGLGAQVFAAGGPGESGTVAAIAAAAKSHVVVLRESLGIPQFAAFVAQFDAMLCHDSGPMHVAAAVGTPVVALFGSQNATVWGPHGAGHTVLQPPLPCTACVSPGTCVPGDSYRNHCVRNITPDRVVAAVQRALHPSP